MLAQQNDSLKQHLNITSTGSFNKTDNYNSYIFANSLIYSIKKEKLKTNVQCKWLFGKQQQMLVNNDFSNSFDLNWYKTFPYFNYWLLFNYNKIYSLKVNDQLQYGAGIAYMLIHLKYLSLNISDGVLNDYSNIYLNDTTKTIYQTVRNSFRIQLKIDLNNRLNFISVAYLQNSFSDSNDYIIKEEATFSYKLLKWLSLSSRFTYDRMNRTGRENTFFTYGLTVENYF
jgi:hypothetical protein